MKNANEEKIPKLWKQHDPDTDTVIIYNSTTMNAQIKNM